MEDTMRTKIFLLLFIVLVVLVGCGKSSDGDPKPGDNGNPSNSEDFSPLSGRKIIYHVSTDVTTSDVEGCVAQIHYDLHDGWFDEETISDDYAYLVVRVHSDQLDKFIEDLKKHTTVESFRRTATDISLTYQETQLKMDSLQAELTRLIELKANASLNDLITINSKISEVERQILTLQNKINEYDQLVEFSVVTIRINSDGTSKDYRGFGTKLADAFILGAKGLLAIGKIILYVLAALLPFAVVGGPITWGVLRFKKGRKENQNKDKE